jgi:hypothetical protein
MPAPEKRRAPRVRVESDARVKIASATTGQVEAQARTRDISSHGAFFYLDHDLVPGAQVEMVVVLPEELNDGQRAWVCCRGTVVRVESTGAADQGKAFGIAAEFDQCSVLPEIT